MKKTLFNRIVILLLVTLLSISAFPIHNGVLAKTSNHTDYDKMPPLLITEIVPSSTSYRNADGYEFIEVYNNTDQPLNFKDYQIIYRYPAGSESDLYWIPKNRDIIISPGKTLVLWIENSANGAATVADFNANYGTDLVENETIVKMPGGMHDQRLRDILIRTNTGEEIVAAQYNKATYDVQKNKGIFYQYPEDGSKNMKKVSAGEKPATPGTAEPDLVPEQPVKLNPETVPSIKNKTPESLPLDQAVITANGKDKFLLSSVTLHYKQDQSNTYQSAQMEINADKGIYSYKIPIQDVLKAKQLTYYIEASNGLNTVKTDEFTLNIEEAEKAVIPPLLITEVVPDTTNVNGANAYEFIEVFNNTDHPVNFRDYRILYRYPNGSHTEWFKDLDAVIQPGKPLVLWVDNGKNATATADGFNKNYGTHLVENVDLIKAPAGSGMANGSERDLVIATNAGDEIAIAGYNKGEKDVFKNKGITYHFPINSKEMIKYSAGEPATPGFVEPELIPAKRHALDPKAKPIISNRTSVQKAKPGETVTIAADANDSGPIVNMAVYYKQRTETDYKKAMLTRDEKDRLFRQKIELSYDDQAGHLEYYFVASNGLNETKSDHFQIKLDRELKPEKPKLVAPAIGAKANGSAALRVNVSNRDGGKLDVGFFKGWAANTANRNNIKVFKNAVDSEPPSSRVSENEVELTEEEYAKLLAKDDQKVMTESEEKFPYHRFEISIDKEAQNAAQIALNWHGSSLSGRKVSMYAWNYKEVRWTLLDKHTAKSEVSFSLSGEVEPKEYVRDGIVNTLIQDEIPPREDYDYSFVWLSDTQFYTEVFPKLYESQVDWIVKKKDEMDIKYVFHTGDIVNTYNQTYQWEFADQYMQRLEDANIPYGVLAGNHDIQLKPEINYDSFYQYFGADRFKNQPYYGKSYENNRGHYDLISSHGTDFIMLYMGWQPTEEGIAWMNEVLAEYPDRFAILNFHEYLLGNGKRSAIGEKLYNEVVLPNENVRLVLGGHYHGSQHTMDMRKSNDENLVRVTTDRLDDSGDGKPDRVVHQLLGDFQEADRGGDGYMNVMNVDVKNNMIYVNTYSPDLDKYDLFPPYTIELDLTPMKKHIATDFFEVNVYTDDEIGKAAKVENGSEAAYLWDDLKADQGYYWYAVARNEAGESAKSDVWHFTTASQQAAEMNSTADLRKALDTWIAKDEIKEPLAKQLDETLQQAEQYAAKNKQKETSKSLEKFGQILEDKSMQPYMTAEAKADLKLHINKLIGQQKTLN